MNSGFGEFVVTGQAILPPLMWLGTGSVEVFALVFLSMIILCCIAFAGSTIPDGLEEVGQRKEPEKPGRTTQSLSERRAGHDG